MSIFSPDLRAPFACRLTMRTGGSSLPGRTKSSKFFALQFSSPIARLLVLGMVWFCATAVSAQEQTKHVLLLHSESRLMPVNVAIDQSIRTAMSARLGTQLDFYNEFLDQTRFSDSQYEFRLKEFLRQKFSLQKLDLVIAFAPAAVAFLSKYRQEIFPGVPVVFCGVTTQSLRDLRLGPNTTGVAIFFDSGATIDLALRLQPDTRQVVVVTGTARIEQIILEAARDGFKKYEERLQFEYLTGLSVLQIKQRLEHLPDHTIVVYIASTRDAEGRFVTGQQALEIFGPSSNVPIYGLIGLFMGRGIVGGRLTNFDWHGTQAADLGLRILNGERADNIPVISDAGIEPYTVDWRELKRFRLSESNLPAGTLVRFRQPTAWELYKWRIVGIISLCIIEAMLIAALLAQRRKRRRAKLELEESEQKLRSIIDNTSAVIYLKDKDGRYLLVNRQFEKLFGFTNELLFGKTDHDVFPAEIADSLRANDARVIESKVPLEFEEVVSRNGSPRTYVSVKVPLSFKTGSSQVLCGISTDITARKEIEDALRRSQALSNSVLSSFSGLIMIVDQSGIIVDKNDGWKTAPENEYLPAPVQVGQSYLDMWKNAANGRREVGLEIVNGVLSVLTNEGTHFLREFTLPETSEPRSIAIEVQPLLRREGGAVIFHTDITSRRVAEVELERHREELTHFARVAAMGELTASLAHELNQPLTAIMSNAQAAQRYLQTPQPDLDELQNILVDVIDDNRRAGQVIQRLRTLLKRGSLEMVPQDLNPLIREVQKLVSSDLVIKGVHLTLELEPGLPPVSGDRVQLQQLLLNLVLNAIDAVCQFPKSDRRVVIRTRRSADDRVEVDVEDSGPGIPPDNTEKIFEAFYTTKTEGMGIGLSISKSIVELHGGRLWVTNNPQRGATFHFALPVGEYFP